MQIQEWLLENATKEGRAVTEINRISTCWDERTNSSCDGLKCGAGCENLKAFYVCAVCGEKMQSDIDGKIACGITDCRTVISFYGLEETTKQERRSARLFHDKYKTRRRLAAQFFKRGFDSLSFGEMRAGMVLEAFVPQHRETTKILKGVIKDGLDRAGN